MLSEEKFSLGKVDHLRSRVTALYSGGVDLKELGDLALEILIARNEVETRLEKDANDSEAKNIITQLRELEKVVISLYALARLGPVSSTYFRNYLDRNYSLYRGHPER